MAVQSPVASNAGGGSMWCSEAQMVTAQGGSEARTGSWSRKRREEGQQHEDKPGQLWPSCGQ
jgi:hypothetical protein